MPELYDPSRRKLPLATGSVMDRSPVPLPAASVPQAPVAPPPDIPQVGSHPLASPVMPPRGTVASPSAVPRTPTAAEQDYEALRSKGSGIHNIKNPVLRTLATIGDVVAGTFAPRAEMLIPGTEGNYAMKMGRAGKAVEDEQQQGLRQAQIRQADAQAAKLARPEETGPSNEVELFGRDEAAFNRFQEAKRTPEKQGGSIHEGADGNFYVIHPDATATQVQAPGGPLGAPKKAESGGTVQQDNDGNMWVVKSDGQAIPVRPKSAPAAPPAAVPTEAPLEGQSAVQAEAPGQLRGRVPAGSDDRTADIKEYEYAKSQNPNIGSFVEWSRVMANLRAPRTTINQEADKLLTPQEAAVLGVRYGTTRAEAAGLGIQPATEAQKITGNYAARIAQSNSILNRIQDDIMKQGAVGQWVQGVLPNVFKADVTQSFEQAERNFLNAVLRRESGAVISPSEMAEGTRQYFPVAGDDENTLKQKAANRLTVEKNFIKSSGNAYEPPELFGGAGTTQGQGLPKVGDIFSGGKVKSVKKIR